MTHYDLQIMNVNNDNVVYMIQCIDYNTIIATIGTNSRVASSLAHYDMQIMNVDNDDDVYMIQCIDHTTIIAPIGTIVALLNH